MKDKENNDRGFKGVWIPKWLWLTQDLNPIEKMFLLEIDSLDNAKGCFASNSHFSELFDRAKNTCSEIITSLEKKGYVTIKRERNGSSKAITKRVIKIHTPSENRVPPSDIRQTPSENREGNNIMNNTNERDTPTKKDVYKEPVTDNHTEKEDWEKEAKERSSDSQQQDKHLTDYKTPFQTLKNDFSIVYEQRFLMKYDKRLKLLTGDEKRNLIERFNNQFEMEGREWKGTIIAARLCNYVDSWLKNRDTNNQKGKL